MKTKFFMNGFCAKLALAVVALAGGMFTSCTQEELSTTFQPGPAVVTVNATAIDALTKTTKTETTSFEYANGLTTTKTETVSVTLGAKTVTGTVDIQPILPGGRASYNVVLFVDDEITYDTKMNDPVFGDKVYFDNSAAHGYGHYYGHGTGEELTTWVKNENDYLLKYDLTYPVYDGAKFLENTWNDKGVVDLQTVKAYIEKECAGYTKTEKKMECTASAWSLYTAWAVVGTQIVDVTLKSKETGEELGSFSVETKLTVAQFDDTAIPGHESHYHYGHGSSTHHGGANAGGGIVIAD